MVVAVFFRLEKYSYDTSSCDYPGHSPAAALQAVFSRQSTTYCCNLPRTYIDYMLYRFGFRTYGFTYLERKIIHY